MRCFEGRAGPRGGGGSSLFSWENDEAPLQFCVRTSTRNWCCFDKIPWGLKYKMLLPLECDLHAKCTPKPSHLWGWGGGSCLKGKKLWQNSFFLGILLSRVSSHAGNIIAFWPFKGVPVGEETVVPEEVQQPLLGWALINLRIKLHKCNTTCVAWSLPNEKNILKPLLNPYASTSILYTKMSEWTIATKNRQRQDLTIIFLN